MNELLIGALLTVFIVLGRAEAQGWQHQEPLGTCTAGIVLPPVTAKQCRFIQRLEKDL